MKQLFRLIYLVVIATIFFTSGAFGQSVTYKIGDEGTVENVSYSVDTFFVNSNIHDGIESAKKYVFADSIPINFGDTVEFLDGYYCGFISDSTFLIDDDNIYIVDGYAKFFNPGNSTYNNIEFNSLKFTTNTSGNFYLCYAVFDDGVFQFKFIKIVVLPQGINVGIESNIITSMRLYPNPVIDYITFEFESTSTDQVYLISSDGQVLETEKSISGFNKIKFDLTVYSAGVYFIRFGHESRRIIKQ